MMKTLAMSSLDDFQNLYKKCTDMKNDNLLLVACFVLFIISIVCIYQDRVIQKQQKLLEQVDTITKHDTIYQSYYFNDTIPQYIEKTKIKIKTDTFYTNTGDTVKVDLKKKEYTNTLIQQEDTVKYHAYLTGRSLEDEDYPKLDSINIQTNRRVINTTTIIEKPIKQRKQIISIRPEITGGYDVINKQWGVVAGIGVGINF